MKVFAAAVSLLLLAGPVAVADEKVKMDEQTKKAVDKALEWLQQNQNKDGSWGNNQAITGFAVKLKGMPSMSAYSTLKSPAFSPSSLSS
jgi:squalene cyclase